MSSVQWPPENWKQQVNTGIDCKFEWRHRESGHIYKGDTFAKLEAIILKYPPHERMTHGIDYTGGLAYFSQEELR